MNSTLTRPLFFLSLLLLLSSAWGQVAQPTKADLLIKTSTSGMYQGFGIYNTKVADTLGTTQKVSAPVAGGATVFNVEVRNAGTQAASFAVGASLVGTDWSIKYFDAVIGGTDITTEIGGAGYAMKNLPAGTTRELRIECSPKTDKASVTAAVTVFVTPSTAPFTVDDRTDKVVAEASLTGGGGTKQELADLMAQMPDDITWFGLNIYGVGTQYFRTPEREIEEKSVMYFRIVNNRSKPTKFLLYEDTPTTGGEPHYYTARDGGTEITKDVMDFAKGFDLGTMQPGEVRDFRCEVVNTKLGEGTAHVHINVDINEGFRSIDDCFHFYFTWKELKIPQPDLAVLAEDQDELKGEDIYNDDEAQTVTQATSRNAPAVYALVLRNDGNMLEPLKLTGTGSTPEWTVAYFDDLLGGNDITAEVTGGGWSTPKLDPQGRLLLRVEVTPATAVPWDTTYPVIVSAISTINAAKADSVITGTICTNLPLTAVRLASTPSSSVVVKRTVTLAATPVGGRNVEYCFYIKEGSGWKLIRGYQASRTCTWTPVKTGTFALLVWAREVGSKRMWDVNATIWNFIVKPTISTVTLTANPALTVRAGRPVLLTASPIGGDQPEYAFFAKSGSGCSQIQPYGATNTCLWTPETAGTYSVVVWVREKGATEEYQINASVVNFVVTPE